MRNLVKLGFGLPQLCVLHEDADELEHGLGVFLLGQTDFNLLLVVGEPAQLDLLVALLLELLRQLADLVFAGQLAANQLVVPLLEDPRAGETFEYLSQVALELKQLVLVETEFADVKI